MGERWGMKLDTPGANTLDPLNPVNEFTPGSSLTAVLSNAIKMHSFFASETNMFALFRVSRDYSAISGARDPSADVCFRDSIRRDFGKRSYDLNLKQVRRTEGCSRKPHSFLALQASVEHMSESSDAIRRLCRETVTLVAIVRWIHQCHKY